MRSPLWILLFLPFFGCGALRTAIDIWDAPRALQEQAAQGATQGGRIGAISTSLEQLSEALKRADADKDGRLSKAETNQLLWGSGGVLTIGGLLVRNFLSNRRKGNAETRIDKLEAKVAG